MSCGVYEATERLENELWRRSSNGKLGEWAPLYISTSMSSAHSPSFQSLHLRHSSFPTLPSLYLRHSSFANPSVASSTSQLILQPFFRFSYLTGFSLTSPGEPPMVWIRLPSQHNFTDVRQTDIVLYPGSSRATIPDCMPKWRLQEIEFITRQRETIS